MLNCPLDTCVYRCQLITHVHIGTICDQKFKMAAHLSNETTCLHRPLFAGPLSGRYRQVWLYYQIFFQGMHQIALFRVKNCKSSLPWEGDTPLPHPPPRALRAHGLGRSAPSQLCPPPIRWPSLRHWVLYPLFRFLNNIFNHFKNSGFGVCFNDVHIFCK